MIHGAVRAWRLELAQDELRDVCTRIRTDGGRLLAIWGEDDTDRGAGFAINVALVVRPGILCLLIRLPQSDPAYPSIADIFPAAARMQRATHDMLGLEAAGSDGEPDTISLILDGSIDIIVNTPYGVGARVDGYEIRSAAVTRGVPCITTVQGLGAAVQGIEALIRDEVGVRSLQDHGERLNRSREAAS